MSVCRRVPPFDGDRQAASPTPSGWPHLLVQVGILSFDGPVTVYGLTFASLVAAWRIKHRRCW